MRRRAKATSAFTNGRSASLAAAPTQALTRPAMFLMGVFGALLLVLVIASPVKAAYEQTGAWQAGSATIDIAVAPSDGSVYTTKPFSGLGDPGYIEKWTASGTAGTPATIGSGAFSGAAVSPVTGNLFATSQPFFGSSSIAVFQPDGTQVGSPFNVDSSPDAHLGADAAGNVYFPNQTDDTVEKFSPSGSLLQTFGPSAGASNLNGPLDAAVDAAGNVYVADPELAVNEVQSVLRGVTGNVATGGTYKLTFDGQTTGGTGTGDVSGISGTGNVNRATGNGTRALLATGTGDLTSGSTSIVNLTTATGAFAVGESISGSNIPSGTTITAVGANTLTLSAAATNTSTATSLTSGSKTLTGVTTSTGTFSVNMLITGTGIPSGTTITAVGANTLTLSAGVTSAGSGSLTAGNITNASASNGSFAVGMNIAGTGLSGSATIAAINSGTLTLSSVPSAAGVGVPLTAGSKTISNFTVSTGTFVVGETLSGAGIPTGTTITAVGANTLTISTPPNATGTGVALSADLGFNAESSTVDAALEALSTIGAGDVSVFGSGASAREVTFGGALAATNVSQLTCNGTGLTYPGAPPSPLCTVTTSTSGLYSAGRVVKFEPDGDFASNFLAPAGKFTALAIDINRTTGDVFVVSGASNSAADVEVTKHNTAGTEVDSFGQGSIGNERRVGVTVNPTNGIVYTNSGGVVAIWDELPKPTAVTELASSLTKSGAKLNGTVNPNGLPITACEFEYGTTASYGQTAPCVPGPLVIGGGETPVPVSASISGLNPDTDYHFRLTATSSGGEDEGDDAMLKTLPIPPPSPTAIAAASVTLTAATLKGEVDLKGETATDCYFEWGVGTAFDKEIDCASLPAGAGKAPASAGVAGLSPSTEYQYRLVVTTAGGTQTSAGVGFTTLAHTCATNPALCPPAGGGGGGGGTVTPVDPGPDKEAAYQACVAKANQAHKKAMKAANKKQGKAKAKAKKAAKKKKAKAMAACKKLR